MPLPPAISGQNSYWTWGMHGCDPEVMIAVLHETPEEIARKYRSVEVVGRMDDPWAMPLEHKTVYLLRGQREGVRFRWEDERFYF